MDQVKLAWVHRFWIIAAVVVILPIVGYFVDTRSLASHAESRARQLEGIKKKLEALKRGPNPNDRWTAAVKKLEQELRKDVDGAWEVLYQRQSQYTTWPAGFEQIRDQSQQAAEQLTTILYRYRDAWIKQFNEVRASVKPVSLFGSKGLVELNSSEFDKFAPGWLAPGQYPTVYQARLAQEDIWLLRALFNVVVRANREATNIRESAVKRILDIKIGGAAVDSRIVATKAALIPADLGQGAAGASSSAAKPGAGSALTGGMSTRTKQSGRYVPSPDDQLFKLIPVYMKLVVDQRKIVPVLCEFANSGIPMQITQVSFAEASERAETSTLGTGKLRATGAARKEEEEFGAAPPKEDEYFHMTELDVWAQAVLFQPPPSVREQEQQKVAQKTAAKGAIAAQPQTGKKQAGSASSTSKGRQP